MSASWPAVLPHGRLVAENCRHLTLVFLGNTPLKSVLSWIDSAPCLDVAIAPSGWIKKWLFLPDEAHARVVAGSVDWLEGEGAFSLFVSSLSAFLKKNDPRPFFPHITIARKPFDVEEWKKDAPLIPFFIREITLYESLGHLHYEPRWSYPLTPPFEEIAHAADLAFLVRGQTFGKLLQHAYLALSFHFPQFLTHRVADAELSSLDEVIMQLNRVITEIDRTVGSPFKAVSFHSELHKLENNLLQWKMIVDV